MKASQAEKGRVFLVNWMFTSFYGLAFAEWVRLLWKHRFDVDPPYGPRAALMTLTSLLRAYETQKDGPRLVDVHVRHPRSSWDIGGAVRPSYIISSSPPTNRNSRTLIMWQALNPYALLSTERYSEIAKLVSPKTRLIDNMDLGAAS
jgi:hypothetical protein